jgi:hypothetical protein
MSTKNLPGGKWRPARKADNLTVICEPSVQKMREPRRLTIYHPPRPVTRIVLHYFTFTQYRPTYAVVSIVNNHATHDPVPTLYCKIKNDSLQYSTLRIVDSDITVFPVNGI